MSDAAIGSHKRSPTIWGFSLAFFLRANRLFEIGPGWWQPIPPELEDRRVEITGPTDLKMIINALISGANVFTADLEDANSPWQNMIQGQNGLDRGGPAG